MMHRRALAWAPAALLLATIFAGCVGPRDDGPDADGAACGPAELDAEGIRIEDSPSDPIADLDLDLRWDHELRNVRTCSLPAIGWTALDPSGQPHKYIGEIDMRGDLNLGAVAVLGNGEGPRVYLVDITDRARPGVLSWIDQANTYIVDVKLSQDGDLLFTASQNVPTDPELEGLPELTGPTGFSVYDIRDRSNPRLVATQPDPQFGCHMLSHYRVNNVDALFCVSQQIRVYRLERVGDNVAVAGFVEYVPREGGVPTPSGPVLADDPTGLLTSGPHDMTVRKDPLSDRVYAVVSHWDAGLRVLDVTELPAIEEIGVWKGEGAKHYAGNVHTAMMFAVGEQRYIAASPEYTTAGTVPSLWVLDATDLRDLRLVGEWFHPGEYDSQGLFLTTHQWQVAPTGRDVTDAGDVRFYLSYNHAGVWVLDLGSILAGDNAAAVLGYNLARRELDPDTAVGNAVLNTWDVNVVDGHIYGSDRATGLWVFHYRGDALGDARVTGFA